MRRPRSVLVGVILSLAGIAWAGCTTGSSGTSPSTADGGGDATSDSTSQADGEPCNPCRSVCPCTPGDSFFSPGNCMTVVCGPDGMWGGGGCVGSGCVDAADEPDATGADSASDGAADARADSTAGDGATDARADVATDSASDAVIDVAAESSSPDAPSD